MKNLFSGTPLMKIVLSIAMSMILCATVAFAATPVAVHATGNNANVMTALAMTPPGTGTELTRATIPAPAQPTINLTATACTNIAVAQTPAAPNPATPAMNMANTAYNGAGSAVNIVDDPKANITAEKYGYVMKSTNAEAGFTGGALGNKTPMAVVIGEVHAKKSVFNEGGAVLL
jgi:hypothetical protein